MDEIRDLIDGDLIMDIPSMCTENEEYSMDIPSMCSLSETYSGVGVPSMCSISPLCSEHVPSEYAGSPGCNAEDVPDNMYPDGYEFLLTHSNSWQLEDIMWIPLTEPTELTIVDINSDKVLVTSKIECQEGNMLPQKETKDDTFQYKPDILEQYPDRRTFQNNICDEKLATKVTLSNHKLIHSSIPEHKQEIKEEKFEYKPNIVKVELHPGRRTFQCDICNKILATKSTLNRHQLIHSTTKRFKCDECEKEFTYKCNLDTHKLNHSAVRAFKCEECGKDFTQKCRLVAHEMIHAGVKAFECDACRKTFTSKSTLNRHKVIHSGIKRFKCDECGKKFNEKCNLDVHQRTHTGFKPFQCEICEKSFSRKHSLKTHKKMHIRNCYIKSEEADNLAQLDFE